MLTHEKKFSDEEFLQMCKDACTDPKIKENYYSTAEIATEFLIMAYGFKVLEYTNCHLFDYSCDEGLPKLNKMGKLMGCE
jgi:hypothetical protein